MLNRHNSLLHAFFARDAYRAAPEGFENPQGTERITVPFSEFKSIVLSGGFDQLPALSLFVLAEWKAGNGFLKGGWRNE